MFLTPPQMVDWAPGSIDTVTRASKRAIREILCAKKTKGMCRLLCCASGDMSLTCYQVDLITPTQTRRLV